MAIVAADWTIDRQTGNIRYIGDDHGGASPSYATVIELHRWLWSLLDDAEYTGDDEADIVNTAISSRSTDNIITLNGDYNLDATALEHLYDGSIIWGGGDEIADGIVNYGNDDVQIQIIQNGAVLSDDWWNYGGAGLNADATQGISHRFMIVTRTGGADVNGRRLIGTCRRFGYTYNEFRINGTSRGNNVLALSDAVDLNNQTAVGTVAGWSTIDNTTEGYVGLDVDNNGSPEYYYSEWNKDIYTVNQLYERLKYITRDGSSSSLYGLNGELFRGITHEITVDTPSGTFSDVENVSWSGGTGQMFAINSTTAPTKMWIQLLTGVAPTDNQPITGGVSSATCLVNVTVTDRTALISFPFCGQSTGSSIIGSYGLGIETTDLSALDKLFDLTNTQVTPPNNVTFTVSGLVVGEDRVLVGPWDGSTYDLDGNPEITYDQFALNGSLTGGAVTSVVISGSIPLDTPNTGTIRVETDSGLYKLCTFTSWTGSTFTISSADFSSDNATTANNVFISYVDKLAASTGESFTGVYVADRSLVIKVRDGGGTPIKEFISSGTLTSSGGSVTAIRTVDA